MKKEELKIMMAPDPSVRRMREASGNIISEDRLVHFFYLLCRDHIVPGEVERLIRQVEECKVEMHFTNGWIARYAQNLRDRMILGDRWDK